MAYLNKLYWQADLSEFDEKQTKVLLVLSDDKFKWRSKERIAKITGMSDFELDEVLSGLMLRDKLRASISKNKNLIFGLRERVG